MKALRKDQLTNGVSVSTQSCQTLSVIPNLQPGTRDFKLTADETMGSNKANRMEPWMIEALHLVPWLSHRQAVAATPEMQDAICAFAPAHHLEVAFTGDSYFTVGCIKG